MLTVSVDEVHGIFYGSKLALNTQGGSVLIRGTAILWENVRIHQKDGSHPILQKKSPPDTENLVWKPETAGNLSAGFQQELPAGSSVAWTWEVKFCPLVDVKQQDSDVCKGNT